MTVLGLAPFEPPRHAIPEWAAVEIPKIDPDYRWRFAASVRLDEITDQVVPHFEHYRVESRTPKGVWITDDSYRKRFILDASNRTQRRWAYEDPRLAFESWIIRLGHRRHYWRRDGRRLDALEWLATQMPPEWRIQR